MKPPSNLRKSLRNSISGLLLVLLLLSGLTGCQNTAEGVKLAEAGIATSDTLAQYYDSLAQDLVDIWEWEAFNSAIRGTSFSDEQQQSLQDQIEAINRRAALARRLGSTYRALKELGSYNASEDVKKSADSLAKSIMGLPPLEGAGVNPSGIFGSIAGDIAGWKQSKDMKKGGELILTTLNKLIQLFDEESDAYKSIAEERGNKVENVVDFLIRHKKVLALPLLQKVPDAVGLKLAGADKPEENAEAIEGLVAIARVRARRIALMSAGAGNAVQQALEQLVRNHKNFRDSYGLSLATVLAGIEKAQSYLDEINKLRSAKDK